MSNNIVPTTSASSPLTYAQANSNFLSKSNLSTALSQIAGTINLNSDLVVNPSLKILSSGINIFNVTSAGSTTTWRNTLDDRFGNVIFNCTNNNTLAFLVQSGGTNYLRGNASQKSIQTLHNTLDDGNGNVLFYCTTNSTTAFQVQSLGTTYLNGNASTRAITTLFNTLDDGSGNMNVRSLKINNLPIVQIMMIGDSSVGATFTQSIGSTAGASTTIILPNIIYNTFDPSILTYNTSLGLIVNQSGVNLYLEISWSLGIGPVNYPNSTAVVGALQGGNTILSSSLSNSDGNTTDIIGGASGIVKVPPNGQLFLTTFLKDPGSSGTPIYLRNSYSLNPNYIHIRCFFQ